MPVRQFEHEHPLAKDKAYINSIIKHEGSASSANAEVLGTGAYGAYVGHGHKPVKGDKRLTERNKQKFIDIYDKAGVTPEMANKAGLGHLYGKEIVVGVGHTLLKEELKDYFTDPKKREEYNTLTKEKAMSILRKDIINHQRQVDDVLEQRGISIKDLSKDQYRTLNEMGFQMGAKKLNEFNKLFKAIKNKDWPKAAYEITNSALGKQTEDRAEYYRETFLKDKSQESAVDETSSTFQPTLNYKQFQQDPSTQLSGKEVADASFPFNNNTLNEDYTEEDEFEALLRSGGLSDEELKSTNKVRDVDYDILKAGGFTPEEISGLPETETPLPDMTQGEAAARGLAQGATLGLPKKVAGVGNWLSKGMDRLWGEGGLEGAIKRGKQPDMSLGDAFKAEDYQAGQKQYQSTLDKARKDWGKTVLASELAGGAILPGAAAMKGASVAKKIRDAAKVAGVEGAVMGGAESEAEDLATLAKDAAIGGMKGAVAGGAFGGLIAGGEKLYRKVKGAKPEDVMKASMLDNDAVDVALDAAEKRARKEKAFNLEILKSVKGFTDKSKNKQLRFLEMKVKDAPKRIKEWAASVEPAALEKYSADEITKIPNSVLKMAKKKGIDPKLVHAYYNWRNDIFNYMKYVNNIGGRSGATRDELISQTKEVGTTTAKQIQKEVDTFKKNIKAGLVTPDSYNEYKMQQYLAEEIQNLEDIKVAAASIGYDAKDKDLIKAVEDEARQVLVNDPLRHKAYRKMATVTNAAELIDDKAGTKVLDTVQDLYVADKQKSGFTTAVSDALKPVLKMREKGPYADMSDEDIIRMIESGDSDPLADAYRGVFEKIRKLANENGVRIDEYKLGQDKYVPMKRKGAAEMIEAMEEKFAEIEKLPMMDDAEINRILKDRNFNPLEEGATRQTEKYNEAMKDIAGKKGDVTDEFGTGLSQAEEMPEYASDIRHLQDMLSGIYGRDIANADMMRRAIGELKSKDTIRKMINPSLRNVHERSGSLPMWARETDLGKMAVVDASSIGDLIYKRPVLDRLDTQIMLLKMKGYNNSADYLNNLKKDILGITRKGTEDRQTKSILRQMNWAKSKPGKLVLGLENAVTSALYPNYLGFNARAVVRNLTQPYSMTTRELGVGIPGDVLALNSTRKVVGEGLAKAQKRFSKLGLVDVRDPKPVDFEGTKSGLRHYFRDSKMARKMDRFIDGYANAAMTMYAKTDTINRLVTAQMSEDIAKLLQSGKTKWLKNAPQTVRNKVQKQLDEGASTDEITQTIGKWLQTKTQLSYAKDDMYEFGREMGPLFAMLSKWPTAVSTDIVTKLMKDGRAGAARASMKYLSPLVLASLLQNGLDREIDPKSIQSREMFGYGGIKSFLPYSSVFGVTDAFLPIPGQSVLDAGQTIVDLGASAGSGRWSDKDTKDLEKTLQRLGETFTPVLGGVSKTKRHVEGLTGKTDKERKKNKRRSKYFD